MYSASPDEAMRYGASSSPRAVAGKGSKARAARGCCRTRGFGGAVSTSVPSSIGEEVGITWTVSSEEAATDSCQFQRFNQKTSL